MVEILKKIVQEFRIPSVSVTVGRGSEPILYSMASGCRKNGSRVPVAEVDKYHIGSCTKAMTATLAALAVQEHKICWHSTLQQIFPEHSSLIHPDYKMVNLQQLLSHVAGLPQRLKDDPLWEVFCHLTGSPKEQRYLLLTKFIGRAPSTRPGTTFSYSNVGYAVAGAMLERVYENDWENLIMEKLFAPLAMHSGGFGAPDQNGDLKQPWGHYWYEEQWVSVNPQSRFADNPVAIAPAGGIHCSMIDFCKFGLLHTGQRNAGFLHEESLRKLHTASPISKYALGWIVAPRKWARGIALTHGGSNTMFTAVMWAAPQRSFVLAVATNCGGSVAKLACNRTAEKLIGYFLGS
jgi:CubicO group peptidase (beta-lactamase class C family)